jgi:hypothetical protein
MRGAITGAAAAVVLSIAVGVSATAATSKPQPVTVMSYNIFQGSELSHSLGAKTLAQLGPAVAADYENVIRSNIPARAQALAAEIQANDPVLVGLQEAVLWRTGPPGKGPVAIPGTATHVSYDFVKLLVRALAARGAHYRAVAITNNLDIQATADFADGKKVDVRYTDRVAILARSGVTISSPQDHNYQVHDTVSVLGAPIPVPDGWASVDVKFGGRHFRFITTHLDGINDSRSNSIRAAEASEILSGPAKTTLPVIFTCDCNATPSTPTHHELVAGGFRDTWAKVHPHLAGLTCCHRSSPSDPETDVADPHSHQGIVERIDYIWSRSPFAILAINAVGLNPNDRTHTKPRLWPSDHLGLVAEFSLP